MDSDQYDVVVIGGGQAGLAIGYHLARQGSRFAILDAAAARADAWRSRWDSLAALHPGALQQPAGAGLSRRPRPLPDP